jgi:hypothetical protein
MCTACGGIATSSLELSVNYWTNSRYATTAPTEKEIYVCVYIYIYIMAEIKCKITGSQINNNA